MEEDAGNLPNLSRWFQALDPWDGTKKDKLDLIILIYLIGAKIHMPEGAASKNHLETALNASYQHPYSRTSRFQILGCEVGQGWSKGCFQVDVSMGK